MRKIYILVLLVGFLVATGSKQASATVDGKPKANTTAAKKKKRKSSLSKEDVYDGKGYNIKLMPAFFYNTMGAEFEYPVSKSITVGVNAHYKFQGSGSDKGAYGADQAYKTGYLVEGAIKYYFNRAPAGLYFGGGIGIGNIVNADGTGRAYSLISAPREKLTNTTDKPYTDPSLVRAQLGVGYQWVIIPRHIVANLMIGATTYGNGSTSGVTPFLNPSVGIIF